MDKWRVVGRVASPRRVVYEKRGCAQAIGFSGIIFIGLFIACWIISSIIH